MTKDWVKQIVDDDAQRRNKESEDATARLDASAKEKSLWPSFVVHVREEIARDVADFNGEIVHRYGGEEPLRHAEVGSMVTVQAADRQARVTISFNDEARSVRVNSDGIRDTRQSNFFFVKANNFGGLDVRMTTDASGQSNEYVPSLSKAVLEPIMAEVVRDR